MVDPQSALLSLGVIILVGLLGALLFHRTKIADALLLIGAGVLSGPVLHLVDPEPFTALLPVVSILAIVVIIFDAGLGLKLEHLAREGLRGFSLSVLAFLDSVLVVVILLAPAVDWSLGVMVLLGVVLGSTEASIVVPLLKRMRTSHRMRTITLLETSLNDIYIILGVVIFTPLLVAGTTNPVGAAASVGRLVLIGILTGAIVGVLLVQTLGRLPRHPSHYVLLLAILFLLYLATERLGGSGILAVLMVAIAVANAQVATPANPDARKEEERWAWSPLFHRDLEVIQGEVFFFLRSFFFFSLGALLDLDLLTPEFWALGALITIAIFLGRFVAVAVSLAGSRTPARDVVGIVILGPRGLTTAALASIPFLQYGILQARDFAAYATVVVVLTNIVTTAGVWAREQALDRRLKRRSG